MYQKGLVPLLIQASPPHLLLYAIEVGDFLNNVKSLLSFYNHLVFSDTMIFTSALKYYYRY